MQALSTKKEVGVGVDGSVVGDGATVYACAGLAGRMRIGWSWAILSLLLVPKVVMLR